MGNRRREITVRSVESKGNPKNVCLIVTEGKNKTELIYFSNFLKGFKFVLSLQSAFATDPCNIFKKLRYILIMKK